MPLTREDVRAAVERAGDEHWRALRDHHEDAYPASRPTPGDVCRGEAERLNEMRLGEAKEFELLELLLRNAGRVLTRGQLIDRVWGADYVGDTKTLDVHVKRLRAKLEEDPARPRHILTVRGLGYKFDA